jgi:hypothetical protein
MPKPKFSSASVDALLKLRDEIEEVLAHRAALLREELSKLGQQIGSKGKVRGSSLKGRKVPVKYRDRSGNTWAGRGAQPTWLREKLNSAPNICSSPPSPMAMWLAWQRYDLRRRCGSKKLSAEATNSPNKKGPGRWSWGASQAGA